MKLLLTILACLVAASAGAQTIKSLGYNTTNGNIVAATNVTFTNSVGFATNARAATRTNLGGTTVGNAVFTATNAQAAAAAVGLGVSNAVEFSTVFAASIGSPSFLSDGSLNEADLPISFSSGAEAGTRTNLGLGATNNVTFSNITANGIVNAKSATSGTPTNATNARGIQWSNLSSEHAAIYGTYDGVAKIGLSVGTSNSLSDVASFRSTGMTVASNAIVGGTLAVTGNVTMSGVGNTAPSQTASSGSSLMTRDLTDKQTLQLSVRPPNTGFFSYFEGGTTAASNGASVSEKFFIRCNPANAASNVSRWLNSDILPVSLGFGNFHAINFSNNLEFGMTALFAANASTNATSRVFFGGTNGYISGTTIARHVGWRADASNNVYATHANGTNYTEVLVTNTTSTMKWWHIAANNGSVVWSIDGTQVASATNGPTGTDGGGQNGSGSFITVSETTAASIIYWDIHQIFTRRNP